MPAVLSNVCQALSIKSPCWRYNSNWSPIIICSANDFISISHHLHANWYRSLIISSKEYSSLPIFVQQKSKLLHLISLNKYVVRLIINQGNYCLMYNFFMCIFLYLGLLSFHIEKILLLVNLSYRSGLLVAPTAFIKKFVVSSLVGFKLSLFSLKLLTRQI